jgi:mono/diheme cytochrome c family protein
MRVLCFAFLAIGAFSAPATAQQAGSAADDLQNGRYLADVICSICHVTGPDQSVEPVLRPPASSFETIAQRSTTSADSIRTFLATTHRDISNPAGMPNPELLDFQIRQVETYLLSLREPSASAPPLSVRKPSAAQAGGSCSTEIARLELALSQARASGRVVGSAPESSAARLHRQPTVESVERAASEAEKTVETVLVFARKLKAGGLDAECASMLRKVELPASREVRKRRSQLSARTFHS